MTISVRKIRRQAPRFVAVLMTCATLGAEYAAAQDSLSGYVPNIGTTKKAFSFGIWGDPQVAFYAPGTKFDNPGNKRNSETVVPRLQQTVALTNQLAPEFVVTLGDNIHNTGEWENYEVFLRAVKSLQMPLYLLMGNHDHVPAADTFATNPVKHREFANFISAQKQINGLELVVYSFDAGDWHFILFSQPGGHGYGVDEYLNRHPEFLNWLDADLQANRERPTMFFTHHPLLPVGRVQFDYYGPGAAYRAKFVELLTRYGNVKYAFFGHVHNTVAAISSISWRYKGVAFIMMPNSANSTRQTDYHETAQSSWGTGMVKLNGSVCEAITFHTLAGETIAIDPNAFAEYDDALYGYLQPEWSLPASTTLRNGGFEAPLSEGWLINHILAYDAPPTQKRLVSAEGAFEGSQYLYLYAKAVDAAANTQSYLITEARQAVSVPPLTQWPVLRLRYRISTQEFQQPEVCAAFVTVAGFKHGERISKFTLSYSLGAPFQLPEVRGPHACLQIAPVLDEWQELVLYPRSDFAHVFPDKNWDVLTIDNLLVTLGVFNDNYSPGHPPAEIGVAFDAVEWSLVSTPTPTTVAEKAESVSRPSSFTLRQNHPNPFHPATEIVFELQRPAQVQVKVFDLTGRLVANLHNATRRAGLHSLTWQPGEEVAEGIYLLVVVVDGEMALKKMMRLRDKEPPPSGR